MKMMKSVVVVVLLHLCLGNNLHTEILKDLSNLTQENFSFPKQYRGPSQEMVEKPCECQLVFATELKLVVSKVNARTEEHKPLLNRLQKNIQALLQISAPEEAGICRMKNKKTKHSKTKTIIVLMGYTSFLKNMNEKDC